LSRNTFRHTINIILWEQDDLLSTNKTSKWHFQPQVGNYTFYNPSVASQNMTTVNIRKY